jgi:AraC family transcriptional regulator
MTGGPHGGSFYGTGLRSRDFGQFIVTERRYAGRMTTPVHSHKRALLCLVLDGGYEERQRNRVFQCTRTTTLFHAAGDDHLEHFSDLGARSLIVELETSWLENTRQVTGTRRQSTVCHDGGALHPIHSKIYNEFLRGDPESGLVIEGALLEIFGEFFRTERSESQRPAWLGLAVDLIQESFPDRLTLAAIAQQVNVHPVHLAQSFRRFHGCTVGEYLRRLRIEYACQQLARSDTPLIQIAMTAGFADQSHFTRTFKRALGVLPSEYRAETRG